MFGEGYAVQVEGMSNRATRRQSGPLDLALFISVHDGEAEGLKLGDVDSRVKLTIMVRSILDA